MASAGVFDGVRVVDLTTGFAGALSTMVMADNGAAVVRVVPAGTEPLLQLASTSGSVQWDRGKDCRLVDLDEPGGRRECLDLVRSADVVVESYGQTETAAWGLDAPAALRVNPDLCYVRIDGFGPHPSMSGLPAHEGLVHAAAGRMADFGRTFGMDRPAYSSSPVAGFGAAQAVLQGVCAVLHDRVANGGTGRVIRTSLLRGLTPFDLASWLQVQFPERYPHPPQVDHVFMAYTPARASDGVWLQFACYAPRHFWQLAETLGLGPLREDPRFAGLPGLADRDTAHAFWEALLSAVATRTSSEWMELFTALGTVGVDVVRHTQGGMDHPQAIFNRDAMEVDGAERGRMVQLGPMVAMSGTPSSISAGPKSWDRAGPTIAKRGRPRVSAAALPLAGVVVVEAASYVAAPIAPVLLSDLGARVIKIEPLEGDPLRGLLGLKLMQGKESVAVDMKRPEGRELTHRILSMADAFIHNFRPGVPERLGIDYQTVRSVNPGIVYLYAGAYGATGPFSRMPAFHPIAGAICGNAALQVGDGYLEQEREWGLDDLKEASLRLSRANEGHPDMVSGCVYASAILMGLLARDRYGEGQSMIATMLGANAYLMSDDWIRCDGYHPRRRVDADLLGTSSLNRLYPTSDGWVFLAVQSEREWSALCSLIGPPLLNDPRFATDEGRTQDERSLGEVITAALSSWKADELEARAISLGVGCVRADQGGFGRFQQLDAAEGRWEVTQPAWHPELETHWRHQCIVDAGPRPALAKSASSLGEHTDAVMAELGYSATTRRALVAAGVVRVSDPVERFARDAEGA